MGGRSRLVRFPCYWCGQILDARLLHHEASGLNGDLRRCCKYCYENPDSNYRKIYHSLDDERTQLARLIREADLVEAPAAEGERWDPPDEDD